jgi:dihydroxyacetone kinase-like protein
LRKTLDYNSLRSFLLNFSNAIMEKKDYLTELDAACGDGDFGVNMYLGFKRVYESIEKLNGNDVGNLFEIVGKTILSSVGGASGPVFGILFIEAGKAVKGKNEVTLDELATMFKNALEKIRLRGGAKVGDKTLIDALEPAVNALITASHKKEDIYTALKIAAESARVGSESTKNLVAKQGKARYLGEQSIGHLDPGAEVIRILFEELLVTYQSFCLKNN